MMADRETVDNGCSMYISESSARKPDNAFAAAVFGQPFDAGSLYGSAMTRYSQWC
jgi:hypothetical protein